MTRALAVDEAKHGVRVNWSVDPCTVFDYFDRNIYSIIIRLKNAGHVMFFQLFNQAIKTKFFSSRYQKV